MAKPLNLRRTYHLFIAALALAALAAACGCGYTRAVAAETSLRNGIAALRDGRQRDAARAFGRALRGNPSPQMLARVGLAYRADGMCPQAITYLDRSLDRMPRQPVMVREALILCLHEAGKHRQAEQVLAAALRFHRDDATALNNLGYVLVDRGLYLNSALPLLERAVELAPDEGFILDSLGWAHYRLGQRHRARRLLERAAALARDHPDVLFHLGIVCRDLGDHKAAARHFRAALKLDPSYAPARTQLLRLP